ncbi:MAG TPA: helix-turn-helix transcriptional regulator [Sediminibacterium sp.]|nr:MAG: ISNCY family transposase [Sphingobacteriia bacterium 35-40-5]HQR94391.1 helix-turn-helix transcriptional regulator [Sediminibacterium sp.]HQS54836.1 helix-turn-helix transcriptional regulator [Sediminibacterium sp.]
MKNKIREERLEKDMTQQALAEAISVSRQTIFAIETGKYIPSAILALKLSRALEKPVESLFSLEKTDG